MAPTLILFCLHRCHYLRSPQLAYYPPATVLYFHSSPPLYLFIRSLAVCIYHCDLLVATDRRHHLHLRPSSSTPPSPHSFYLYIIDYSFNLSNICVLYFDITKLLKLMKNAEINLYQNMLWFYKIAEN